MPPCYVSRFCNEESMLRRQNYPSNSAFSLVEISIVLAIIGLLVGGVLSGQSLLKGQRLRTVLTDASNYATAINQFKQKYGELPGDMPTATSVWGSDASLCTSALDTAGGTCNGNGDGFLNNATGANATGEAFQLWKQLVLAGLIKGTYTGSNGPVSAIYDVRPGINVPKGALENSAYWHYGYWGEVLADNGAFFTGNYTNAMAFGTQVLGDWPSNGVITPREALELDTKGDDGKPAFGSFRMFARTWSGNLCVTSDAGSAAEYSLASNNIECRVIFMSSFMQGK